MSDVYVCNWNDCLVELNKRDMVHHVLVTHVEEERVPYYCTLCHYRTTTLRLLERHVSTYRKHKDAIADLTDKEQDFLKVSLIPYFVVLGTDRSVDAILKSALPEEAKSDSDGEAEDSNSESEFQIREFSTEFSFSNTECQTDETFQNYKELKAEINILKGSHQAELNRFADFIARKETTLKHKSDEVKFLKEELVKKDDKVRVLERNVRHKDNEIESLRRKLRFYENQDYQLYKNNKRFDSERDEPEKKKMKSVVQKLF